MLSVDFWPTVAFNPLLSRHRRSLALYPVFRSPYIKRISLSSHSLPIPNPQAMLLSKSLHARRMPRTLLATMTLALLLARAVLPSPPANEASGQDDRYLHYDPIKNDTVPCSKKLADEPSNCRPQHIQPYHRPCSKLEKCRGEEKPEDDRKKNG